MKTIYKVFLMLLLLISGGGKAAAQNRIWAIFDGRSSSTTKNGTLISDGQLGDENNPVYQSTWAGARATDDFVKDSEWVQRDHAFMPINGLGYLWGWYETDPVGISVHGKSLFNGIKFKAANNASFKTRGSIELIPREYRVFLKQGTTFTVSVPKNDLGFYIWIEALTNDTGLNFTVQSGSQTISRFDRYYSSNKDPLEKEKHIFTYYIWPSDTGKDYTINPSGDCFIYMVGVLDHPMPILYFNNIEIPKLGQSATNSADIYYADVHAYPENGTYFDEDTKSENFPLEYSSDDETVVKVVDSRTGEIKAVGKGKATITVTTRIGIKYGSQRQFTLEYPCSESYTVEVADDNVIEANKKTSDIPDDTQELWQQFTFTNNNENLLTLYLGGWKYQSGSALQNVYVLPNNKSLPENYMGGDGKQKVDKWGNPAKYSVGEQTPKEYMSVPFGYGDEYRYNMGGSQNGKSEFLYGGYLLEGDYVYKFKEKENERKSKDGVTQPDGTPSIDNTDGKGNPFTVPCFGSFIKIEPECDGLVTLYLIQNGSLDYFTQSGHPNANSVINMFGWRPVFIVDEAGNRLSSDEVQAVTKQRCLVSREDETIDLYDKNGEDVVKEDFAGNKLDDDKVLTFWQMIREYKDNNTKNENGEVVPIYDLHKDAFEKYWKRRGDNEIVLNPDITGDGWVIISKGYVKYQFKVKAGKSYYVFSNKSAIGYCGATFLPYKDANVLDSHELKENGDNLQEILNGKESVMVKNLKVNHTFHEGWNSICLPFSITESKMRSIFGSKTTDGNTTKRENYELIMYNGATIIDKDYDKVHFFHHVYQDIIAGYPYMLYIPKGNDIVGKTSFEVKNVTIENVKRPTITTSSQYMPKGSDFDTHANTPHFVFTGVYNPTTVPEGSYLVVSSGIQRYKKVEMPGYRSYLCPIYKSGESQYEVKRIAATNLGEMTYIWDEANPIESIFADDVPENEFAAPSNVYSVSGQLVRQNSTSLDGLPKGIYIVNGKKYFVK